MSVTAIRSERLPSSAVPLAYFGLAHVALALALAALIGWPELSGGFFYQRHMLALTHLVTLGWLSGSILGALYIVAPLALGCALPARRGDWIAWTSYAIGLIGMVAHFWIAEYNGMVWSALMVTGAIAWVGARVWRGLTAARLPWPIALHVRLAFLNILIAACVGMLIGLNRTYGFLNVSPMAVMYAHAHVAAIGWVGMMAIGISYRLIPMMLPCAMPSGGALVWRAVLLQSGVAVVATALIAGAWWTPVGAVLIAGGFSAAMSQLRRAAASRRPRPPNLPSIDWSIRQVAGAFIWLVIAMSAGLLLSMGATAGWYAPSAWIYGVAGLVGWLAQMVAAVQGRLLPLYVWYRALDRRAGAPPDRAVHELPSGTFAAVIFAAWTIGVPLLAAGLALSRREFIRTAAICLLGGVAASAVHLVVMVRRANGNRAKLSSWTRIAAASSTVSRTPRAARSSPPPSRGC